MLIVLFGLAGAGKTYVGNLIGNQFNAFVWEADELLTEEMHLCIKERRSFTQEMRDQYFSLVIEKINMLCKTHEHVVVSQAFYKNKNREQVLTKYPECLFLQIKAELPILQARLYKRNNSVDANYAHQISLNFEEPSHKHEIIYNNNQGDSNIIDQLRQIPELAPILGTSCGYKT